MPKPIHTTADQGDNGSISFTQTLPLPVYKALLRYVEDKGFSREQEVLRVLVTHFLTVNGYWPTGK